LRIGGDRAISSGHWKARLARENSARYALLTAQNAAPVVERRERNRAYTLAKGLAA